MFGGDIAPEELLQQDPNTTDGATILYGIGNWYFINGQPEKAYPLWRKIVGGSQWAAFGFIGAEAEIARQDKTAADLSVPSGAPRMPVPRRASPTVGRPKVGRSCAIRLPWPKEKAGSGAADARSRKWPENQDARY